LFDFNKVQIKIIFEKKYADVDTKNANALVVVAA
jgi:hypothetical protein